MRTLIAIPAMDTVHTGFARSMMNQLLRIAWETKPGEIDIIMPQATLIYDARNIIAQKAVQEGFDRVLWFDSDMMVPADTFRKLSAHLDAGHEFVSGVYFTRKKPVRPTIFSKCRVDRSLGMPIPDTKQIPIADIPEDELFEIEGCGFGCVMTSVKLLDDVMEEFGIYPFYPLMGFGEDLSFCLRVREMGRKIMCDSSLKCKHIGFYEFGEEDADEEDN